MSDYDRGKYYGKKKFQGQKESSGFGRSYYGRRSPSGSSQYSKDFSKESTSKGEGTPKIKQPTILIKAREHTDESVLSPKRSQKEHESVSSTISTITEVQASVVKSMTKSVKFLEDSILFSENIQEYMQENSDFLVVGVVGAQGVGKSTILNLIAHNSLTEDLKRVVFKNSSGFKGEEYGDNIKLLTDSLNDIKVKDEDKIRNEVFKIQSTENVESNSNATKGIDLFVTSNRVLLLDCQPFMSVSVLDELVQSENKRSNIVSEFIPLENSAEIQGLQVTAFLMSVCHVLIVVQDWFFDSNIVRFIQTAEMLKPTHSNPEDELNEHFPHLLMVHNKAQMEDFSPRKFKTIQEVYHLLFQKTRLQKDSCLGLSSSKLISCLDEDICGEPFNVFLIPEYNSNSNSTYNGHPPMEDLVKKLRANILGAIKNPLTHVQLTEKTWLLYCAKVWDNVKKSSFFVEYTKLMPYFLFALAPRFLTCFLTLTFLLSAWASFTDFFLAFFSSKVSCFGLAPSTNLLLLSSSLSELSLFSTLLLSQFSVSAFSSAIGFSPNVTPIVVADSLFASTMGFFATVSSLSLCDSFFSSKI